MRPAILKLATYVSLQCGTYTGVTPNDPEYKILDCCLTDEMAKVAMGLRVRKDVTAAEVLAFCRDKLRPHTWPQRIVFVEALPLTANGKIDRLRLRVGN